ncbi:MAG: KH domain-containing protein [Deltaproteobacteria bacterium]|nr:KH domain-containing protein [Deltaproteobacteria bacterium]
MNDEGQVTGGAADVPRVDPKVFLEDILRMMGTEAAVDVSENDDAVKLNIRGGDRDVLLGNGGVTLAALQLIVNRAKNRGDAEAKRVIIDTDGYRTERADSFEGPAQELAKLAVASGKPVAVYGMNAVDRRSVHVALKGDRAFETHSEGEDPFRKIVVQPRKEREDSPRRDGGTEETGSERRSEAVAGAEAGAVAGADAEAGAGAEPGAAPVTER